MIREELLVLFRPCETNVVLVVLHARMNRLTIG